MDNLDIIVIFHIEIMKEKITDNQLLGGWERDRRNPKEAFK